MYTASMYICNPTNSSLESLPGTFYIISRTAAAASAADCIRPTGRRTAHGFRLSWGSLWTSLAAEPVGLEDRAVLPASCVG